MGYHYQFLDDRHDEEIVMFVLKIPFYLSFKTHCRVSLQLKQKVTLFIRNQIQKLTIC